MKKIELILFLLLIVQLMFGQLTMVTYKQYFGEKTLEYNLIAFNENQGINYRTALAYDPSDRKIFFDESKIKITAIDKKTKKRKDLLYDIRSKKLEILDDWSENVSAETKELSKSKDVDGYHCKLVEETDSLGTFSYWNTLEKNYNWMSDWGGFDGTIVEAYRNDKLILHLESIKEVAYSEAIFPSEILKEILAEW
ncbi:MAG: hypothetical protein J5709_01445 [Bacteroidales bacterium]|nr:hypothetical protein [Bacteroidales bacterium]